METVNKFAKIRKLRSGSTVIKHSRSLLECPTITAFVAALDAKAFNCTELLKSYLAGGNRIINCHRQTNRNHHNWKHLTKHMAYVFYKNHICVFLIS